MTNVFQKHLFSSGLTLLAIPMPQTQSVTALVLIRTGSRNETKRTSGLSHFLEHMVFKGTAKYPTAQKIAVAVDGIGAEFNAFTGKEYTGFYIKAARQHLPFALEMLSELVLHPLLPPAELEKERGVIIEEINMYEDNPMANIGNRFEELLYGDTPLGWQTIGTKANILSVQRQDFADYMDRYYRPANMVLAVAGSFDRKTILLAEKYFAKKNQKKDQFGHRPLVFSQTKPGVKVCPKKTEQAHLCLGVRTFPRGDKRRYALGLLSTILGGNMSSRLFEEVREKRGLAYYVRTGSEYYRDNGYLVTQAGTDLKKAFDAVKVINQEYGKMIGNQHGLTAKELNKAKEYVKGKLILGLEDSHEVAGLYGEDWLLEGKIRTPEEILQAVERVKIDEVLAIARTIFRPENLNLAVIGPYGGKENGCLNSIL